MLPEGWIRKKVTDLFDVQLGKMLNQDAKMQNPQYEYLGNSDIQWGKINTENLKTMYFSVKELQKFNIEFGDVLMSLRDLFIAMIVSIGSPLIS